MIRDLFKSTKSYQLLKASLETFACFDFFETFSPVVKPTTILVTLTWALALN